jgi:hypothetical protein
MNGIYLTQEGKAEIEAKIAALEEVKHNCKKWPYCDWNEAVVEQNIYKKILSSATILPVEESWEHGSKFTNVKYKQGVIIHSKQ